MPSALAFNPEFMREGSSVADFNTPSRTIVGALEERSSRRVLSLYSHLPGGKITTDIETAELVKYVDNTWHALKVAFTNEIAVVASTLGYRQRRGDEHFRRGQPAQHFQGLYAARLCLWRLVLAEGLAGARLSWLGLAICRCRSSTTSSTATGC